MNYTGVPSSVPAGLSAAPIAGAAMGSIWLILAGITLLVLSLAIMRLLPKQES